MSLSSLTATMQVCASRGTRTSTRIIHNVFNHGDTGDTEKKIYVTNLLIRSFAVCPVFAMTERGNRS